LAGHDLCKHNCSDNKWAWPGLASNLFSGLLCGIVAASSTSLCQDRKMLRNVSKGAVRKAVTELGQYPKPGEKLHGFTLLRSKHVPELELTALHLQHDKTGADYLHVAREDKNNVFSIGFKTNPPDDTGIPHILEHTTLCGSEK
jgi:hypothetical protein